MDKTSRNLPHVNERLFELWGQHPDERRRFLDSISLADGLIEISERHFGGAEFEASSWNHIHEGLLTGRASYLRQQFDWEFTLEERRQPFIESLGRLSASYNFYTAFGELHLAKFYALTFGFLRSLDDNNVLSASIALRSLFEVIGTFSSYASAGLPMTSESDDISKLRINKILDIMLTRKSGYVSEENYLELSKQAIDDFFERLEGRNNRLGRKIYSFLCNFTHPSYLSNDFLLKFYGHDAGDWRVEYPDAADKAYSWSIAFDYDTPPQISVIMRAFRFLTLCFIDSVNRFYSVPLIQFRVLQASLHFPAIQQEKQLGDLEAEELYAAFMGLKQIIDSTISFDAFDEKEEFLAFKSGKFNDLIGRALEFFETWIASYWDEISDFSESVDKVDISEDLDLLKLALSRFK